MKRLILTMSFCLLSSSNSFAIDQYQDLSQQTGNEPLQAQVIPLTINEDGTQSLDFTSSFSASATFGDKDLIACYKQYQPQARFYLALESLAPGYGPSTPSIIDITDSIIVDSFSPPAQFALPIQSASIPTTPVLMGVKIYSDPTGTGSSQNALIQSYEVAHAPCRDSNLAALEANTLSLPKRIFYFGVGVLSANSFTVYQIVSAEQLNALKIALSNGNSTATPPNVVSTDSTSTTTTATSSAMDDAFATAWFNLSTINSVSISALTIGGATSALIVIPGLAPMQPNATPTLVPTQTGNQIQPE